MPVKYIDQVDIKGKRVLIRVDYNVPLDENQNITDTTRINATLKTINYCLEQNAKIILVSHLGRPKGQVVPEMSLAPVATELPKHINKDVKFIKSLLGQGAKEELAELKEGEIALLENIRFYPGETKNDQDLGKQLAELADVYVNDAFATAHRSHSSNDAVTKFVPVSCAGFLLRNEIEYFDKAMNTPERPLVAVIGGSKVSSKLQALNNIVNKVDTLIIGGGMAYTFLKAQGYEIGQSLCENDLLEDALKIMAKAKETNTKLLLPIDIVTVNEFSNDAEKVFVDAKEIPADREGIDAGPKTIELFSNEIKNAKTVVWNGPMGVFEMPNFAIGTNGIANAIAESDCLSIIGGGDSVSAVKKAGVADKMSYISTGGGAFLELLEGKELPAIVALEK